MVYALRRNDLLKTPLTLKVSRQFGYRYCSLRKSDQYGRRRWAKGSAIGAKILYIVLFK